MALVAVVASGCTGESPGGKLEGGDDDDDAACELAGEWTGTFTVVDGSDPLCPSIEPTTLTDDEDTTSAGCDPGCTCATDVAQDTCAVTMTESCADAEVESDVACTMELTAPDRLEGTCELDVHVLSPDTTVHCTYDIVGTPNG
jgi:hypothetical protein